MHVLVTGGAGFIGSHTVDALLARGDSVTVLDNFDPYYDPEVKRANLNGALDTPRFKLMEGDIRDQQLVNNMFGEGWFDAVVHLAALAGVRNSIDNPLQFNSVNIDGTVGVLAAAAQYGKPRFIMASTSSVYGLGEAIPYREDDPLLSPVSPYGASKIAAEKYCAIYHHVHGLQTVSLRLFTAYGERQRPDMAIHKFARLILDEHPVPVYGDGSTSRDYTCVGDVVGAILSALDSDIQHGVFNIGGGEVIELKRMVAYLESALGMAAQIDWLPEQQGDPPHTSADISMARDALGYNPKTRFADGVQAFARWLKAQ